MRRAPLVLADDRVVDAVVGYRDWLVLAADGRAQLYSPIVTRFAWPKGRPLEMECCCRNHWRNTCGIYAWADQIFALPHAIEHYVHGEVYLWGAISVHERGYRAQFAQPAALYVYESSALKTCRLTELAALQYGIPVVLQPAPILTLGGGMSRSIQKATLRHLGRRKAPEERANRATSQRPPPVSLL